jgi:hypothetical protein
MLVIGSCTGSKSVGSYSDPLLLTDFDSEMSLNVGTDRLSQWSLQAADLYTGMQHRYLGHLDPEPPQASRPPGTGRRSRHLVH